MFHECGTGGDNDFLYPLYIFLQVLCQILVDPTARLRQTITLSLKYEIHGTFMYFTYHNSLLLVISI
jgi:hypothetical protein